MKKLLGLFAFITLPILIFAAMAIAIWNSLDEVADDFIKIWKRE